MRSLREQFRSNAVALISLAVALTSLSYNTWRNERTEHNRNIRTATFEILTKLSEFERIVYLAQYDRDLAAGNPRTGWTLVIVIRDLSKVVPGAVPHAADHLSSVWGDNWGNLGKNDEMAVTQIDDAIATLRDAALATLQALN